MRLETTCEVLLRWAAARVAPVVLMRLATFSFCGVVGVPKSRPRKATITVLRFTVGARPESNGC